MIAEFVKRFDANRENLKAQFLRCRPESYTAIVKAVVAALAGNDNDDYETPDAERITVIDHGDYQGTLLYVIGTSGYQPSKYWAVYVSYGSCSVCDTLQAISDNDTRDWDERQEGTSTESQADSYLTLALHIVQRLKEI